MFHRKVPDDSKPSGTQEEVYRPLCIWEAQLSRVAIVVVFLVRIGPLANDT